MRPLTETVPKPLLPVAGRPVLEHLFDALPVSIDEVLLVVGYRGDQLRQHFTDQFGRFRIRYVHQEKPEGTARALALCRHLLEGERFLSLYADDLHGAQDLEALLSHELSVLVKEVEHPELFGVVTLSESGHLVRIVEKPERPESRLVVTGPALLDERIFEVEAPAHARGEYYLAEAIGKLVEEHPVVAVRQTFWVPIGYPEDLAKAEAILARRAVRV